MFISIHVTNSYVIYIHICYINEIVICTRWYLYNYHTLDNELYIGVWRAVFSLFFLFFFLSIILLSVISKLILRTNKRVHFLPFVPYCNVRTYIVTSIKRREEFARRYCHYDWSRRGNCIFLSLFRYPCIGNSLLTSAVSTFNGYLLYRWVIQIPNILHTRLIWRLVVYINSLSSTWDSQLTFFRTLIAVV